MDHRPSSGKSLCRHADISTKIVDPNLNDGNSCGMCSSEFKCKNIAQDKTSSKSQESYLVDGALCSKADITSNAGRITVDAVHPLFTGYRNIKHDQSTSTDNQQFYCSQCNIHFELTQEAVNLHFTTKQHNPIDNKCVYCHCAVYEYFYNENRYYYHKCNREEIQDNGKEVSGPSNKST